MLDGGVANWIRPDCGPPCFDSSRRAWRVSRYQDVVAVLRSPDLLVFDWLANIRRLAAAGEYDADTIFRVTRGWSLFQNAPKHSALRRWLVQALQVIGPGLAPERVRRVVSELMTPVPAGETIDAVSRLCDRVPEALFAEALGVPTSTISIFTAATIELSSLWRNSNSPATLRRIGQLLAAMEAEASGLMAMAHRHADAPLAAVLARTGDSPDLDEADIANGLSFLFVSGIETTASALASSIALCLVDARARACFADLAKPPRGAMEEVLRRVGAIHTLQLRSTVRPIVSAGWSIPAGATVFLEIEQANHDPSAYPDPFRFDPHAARPSPLHFGMGAHACVGAVTARSIIASCLTTLFTEWRLTLAGDALSWEDHPTMRRLQHLPLRAERVHGDSEARTLGQPRGTG
ncbi:MAG: cytochrome P450 [Bauldia sp.]|nr:cytochrome P450 [Bauldia sp.]